MLAARPTGSPGVLQSALEEDRGHHETQAQQGHVAECEQLGKHGCSSGPLRLDAISAERKRERLDARVDELDLKLAILDGPSIAGSAGTGADP